MSKRTLDLARASVLVKALACALALGTPACRGILGVEDLPPLASDAGTGAADDASDEASADAVPGARYCDTLSPPAQLCADFDGTGPYGEGFDNGTQFPDPGAQRGGTLARDTTSFLSGPGSILLQTPAVLQATDAAAAILMKTLPSVTPRLAISFDILIDSEDLPTGEGFVILAAVDYGIGAAILLRDSRGLAIAVVPDQNRIHLTTRLPVGVWKTVDLTIQNEGTDGGADGEVTGGVDAAVGARTPMPAKYQQVTTKPHMTIGPSVGGPAGPFKTHIDNVRVYYGR